MIKRIWKTLRYWWNPPATTQPGKTPEPEKYRPIPIELGFRIDADGKVFFRSRKANGDRRIDEKFNVVEMVHAEYNYLVSEARKRHELQRRIESLRRRLHAVLPVKQSS